LAELDRFFDSARGVFEFYFEIVAKIVTAPSARS